MELNQFRDVDVVLDKANDNIIQKQFVSAGDKDGRSLTVQITENGVIGEVAGATLNLYWHNQASGLTDLSAFYVVDRATSVFKIDYPQNMLTPGKVIAYIQILHGGKVTHTKPFEITVQKLAGTTRGVLATAEYGALVTTLAKANEFETDIADVTAQLAQKANKFEVSTETSNRVVSDTNLQNQINSIVLQGTSGDSSAEVAQAKTDVSGGVFPTLKGRIDNIEKAIYKNVNLKYFYDWKVADLPNGELGTSTKRLVTPTVKFAEEDLFVSLKNKTNYRYGVHYFTKSGTWINFVGWITEPHMIKKGSYYKLITSNSPELDITNVRGDVFENINVTHKNSIENISTPPTRYLKSLDIDEIFYPGTLTQTNFVSAPPNTTVRYATPNFLTFSNDIEIYTSTGYRISAMEYSTNVEGTVRDVDTGWFNTQPFKVNPTKYYRFLVAREDNGVITKEELKNFKIFSSTGFITDFAEMESKINALDENIKYPAFYSSITPAKTRFISHRGRLELAPENTIPAFEIAGQEGFYSIETDIYRTTDGHYVCHHDATVDRMTDGTGDIINFSLAQLRGLNIDSGNNIINYPNLKIPTFEDYLKICRKHGSVAMVEIQTPPDNLEYIDEVVNIIKRYGMENSCILTTFHFNKLERVRSLNKNIHVMLNVDTNLTPITEATINNIKRLGNAGIHSLALTEEEIKTLHYNGSTAGVWVKDTKIDKELYSDYLCDFITTDTNNGY